VNKAHLKDMAPYTQPKHGTCDSLVQDLDNGAKQYAQGCNKWKTSQYALAVRQRISI